MLDIDELRKEIAIRHNVLLTPDDPIFVTTTLSSIVLRHYLAILEAQSESHKAALTALLLEHEKSAKKIGSDVITAATTHVATQVKEAVATAAAEAAAAIRQEIAAAQAASHQVAVVAHAVRAARGTAIAAAAMAGVCAAVAVGAILLALLH